MLELIEGFALNPFYLVYLIFGLTESVKKIGLKGNVLALVSMLIGGALAGLYYWTILNPAISPVVSLIFFVLLGSIATNGVYDAINKRFPVQK